MAVPPRVTAGLDPSGIRCVRFSPDSQHLWVAGVEGAAHRIDVETWAETSAVSGPVGAVNSLSFDPSGRRLVRGGADRSLHAVDTRMLETVGRVAAHDAPINSVALGPAGELAVVDGWSTVVAVGDGPDLVAWSLGAGRRRWDLALDANGAALRGTGGSVVTVDVVGDVRLCDASHRRLRGTLQTGSSGPMAWWGASHLLAIADHAMIGVWRYGGDHVDLEAWATWPASRV
ncbi:MAG: hypothetical protein GY698_17570 [Actinomycetia bacterium]|nr:hypothetical protein [Actinomycetes bacterium]